MARLTAKERNSLPTKDFVEKSTRGYPINDMSHARAALSMSSQHASSALKAKVKEAVHRKFPGIKQGD